MSNRQTQIIVVLLAASIILSGVNTYLILDNQSKQGLVNEATTAQLGELGGKIDTAQAAIEANYGDLKGRITATDANLSTLREDVAAQDNAIKNGLTSVNASLQSSVGSLRENMDTLASQTPAEIYEDVYRSVVIVTTSVGQGTGFLYDSDHHIVTNWHVVNDASSARVEYYDGTSSTAVIVGKDAYSDLAVLIPTTMPEGIQPLKLGNSSATQVGDIVVAVGNPYGASDSLSSGYVSRRNLQIDVEDVPLLINEFQLDLTIAPGSSGGVALNVDREVIGVTNAGDFDSGYCWAVPSNIVARVADGIIAEGRYEHPYFGFSLHELSSEDIEYFYIFNLASTQRGLMIMSNVAGSPAALAGLQPAVYKRGPSGKMGYEAMDIILAVDGVAVNTMEEYVAYVYERVSPGQGVDLTVWRTDSIIHVSATPVAREQY